MFKIFTEQEVPKSALDMAYSPANPDPVSKLIRVCRWLFSAAMVASLALIAFHVSRGENRFSEWIWYLVLTVGNYALYLLERWRKKKHGTERQRRDDIT